MARVAPEKAIQSSEEADSTLSLDARLSGLLEAIEAERLPSRLLELAGELQQELSLRKQCRSPN